MDSGKLSRSIPVFRYDGTLKVFYNGFLILAALAGTIITSYRLTFQHFQFDTVYWLITIVYLLDIPWTFNQSIKKGLVVYADRRSIARMYLRGWFPVDLVSGLPLAWMFSMIPGSYATETESHMGVVLGIIVLTKVLKMAKISKVSAIFADIRGA